MKVLRKNVVGKRFSSNEMNELKGGSGSMSDVNNAAYCKCGGSTQGWFWCDDNKNSEIGCTCQGNNNNH